MRRAPLALFLLTIAASHGAAQGSPSIAPNSTLYRDVDRLVDLGLVDTVLVGQRPYSRNEILRVAHSARRRMESGDGGSMPRPALDALQRILAVLGEHAPTSSSEVHRLSEARVGGLGVTEPARAIQPNGLGFTEADLRPLLGARHGRLYPTGTTAELETESWARVGGALTLAVRPRVALTRASDGNTEARAEILGGAARLLLGNVALSAGRQNTYWGNAPMGGLFFSGNGPALDMIRIANDHPFALPWLGRRLGPAAATLQIADVGPSVKNTHSRLVSYKLSVQPARAVELGATFSNNFGGAGSRPASAADRFIDLVPFLDIFRHHVDTTDVVSDKLLGLDARWRVDGLGGATLYSELALEDFDVHRVRSILTEDAGWVIGAIVPRLVLSSLSAQVSYHATGLRFYEHHLIQNGFASRRFLLGDPLGRDGKGLYASARLEQGARLILSLDAATERRSDDSYLGEYTQPGAQGLVFRRVAEGAHERRNRLVTGAEHVSLDGRTMVRLRGGAETVRTTTPASAARKGTYGLMELSLSRFN